jgi:predicted urease superfamily metal-dependent hydrolase
MNRKETLHYVGAAGIFTLIILLLLFLSYVEIPPVNKDLFVAIVGTLVSSLGIVVYVIIGQQPDEVNGLKKKNESLEEVAHQMEKRNDQLEQMIITIQEEMISKLTIMKPDDCSKDDCINSSN